MSDPPTKVSSRYQRYDKHCTFVMLLNVMCLFLLQLSRYGTTNNLHRHHYDQSLRVTSQMSHDKRRTAAQFARGLLFYL